MALAACARKLIIYANTIVERDKPRVYADATTSWLLRFWFRERYAGEFFPDPDDEGVVSGAVAGGGGG
jgi:hypothetical protein